MFIHAETNPPRPQKTLWVCFIRCSCTETLNYWQNVQRRLNPSLSARTPRLFSFASMQMSLLVFHINFQFYLFLFLFFLIDEAAKTARSRESHARFCGSAGALDGETRGISTAGTSEPAGCVFLPDSRRAYLPPLIGCTKMAAAAALPPRTETRRPGRQFVYLTYFSARLMAESLCVFMEWSRSKRYLSAESGWPCCFDTDTGVCVTWTERSKNSCFPSDLCCYLGLFWLWRWITQQWDAPWLYYLQWVKALKTC